MSTDTKVTPIRKRRPAWTFADRVRRVRRDMEMTQETFSALIEVDRQTYSAWETGRNTPDLADVAVKLEDATGVDRLWFLGWDDGNAPIPKGDGGTESGRPGSNRQHSAWNVDATVLPLLARIAA